MDSAELILVCPLMVAAVLLFLPGLEKTNAQESIRPSLAGWMSAESRHSIIEAGRYNLKLGPALLGMGAGAWTWNTMITSPSQKPIEGAI
jgi:hypothetical protein